MRHAIDSSKYAVSSKFSSNESSDSKPALFRAGKQEFVHCDDEAFSMREILANAEFFSGNDVCFHGIAETASLADPGQLVVYRIGESDPSKLIADAMARGAAGILTEQVLPCPLPQCIVGDVELAMASIAAHTLERPDLRLLTIGVVGSAGKTSAGLLIASLLRDAGNRTAYQTDLGDCDGIVQSTSPAGLPSGESLVHWLSEVDDGQCQAAVIELCDDDARHGLYESVQFDVLVVTGNANVSSDFGPSGLQCMLEQLKPTGVVVALSDDSKAMRVIRDSGSRFVTYGMRDPAELSAKIVDQSGGMSTLMLTHGDTTTMMETPLCGGAMAANLLAAASVGILVDRPLSAICDSLSRLRTIPGRMQQLVDFDQADVIIDAAGNPQRTEAAMRAARAMRGLGRMWCVLVIGENDSPEQLAQYGAQLERFSDKTVITCARAVKENYLKASHYLLDGVQKCAAMRMVADIERAIHWTIGEAQPGDTILILGGVSTHNAHGQRSDIQQLAKWVDAGRKAKGLPVAVPAQAKPEPKIIKLFDSEGE